MANYTSELKPWGAKGVEYPDSYFYIEDEPPVDDWDNFFNSNTVKDVHHLIALTNKRIESSKGTTEPNTPEDGNLFADLDDNLLKMWSESDSDWKTVIFNEDLQPYGRLDQSETVQKEWEFTKGLDLQGGVLDQAIIPPGSLSRHTGTGNASDTFAYITERNGSATVTSGSGAVSGSLSSAFSLDSDSEVTWDGTSTFPVTIEVDLGRTVAHLRYVGLNFIRQGFPDDVSIEVYDSSAATWATILDVTGNTDAENFEAPVPMDNVSKVRLTMSGVTNSQNGTISLNRIWGIDYSESDSGGFVRRGGDTVFGDLSTTGAFIGETLDTQSATVNDASGDGLVHILGNDAADARTLVIDSDADAGQNDDAVLVRGNTVPANATDTDTVLSVKGSGHVGINTYTPGSYALKVIGDVNIDGELNVGGGNIATKTWADNHFVNADGDTMVGDLDMNGYSVLNLNSLTFANSTQILSSADTMQFQFYDDTNAVYQTPIEFNGFDITLRKDVNVTGLLTEQGNRVATRNWVTNNTSTNADLLDGFDSSEFAIRAQNENITGDWNFDGRATFQKAIDIHALNSHIEMYETGNNDKEWRFEVNAGEFRVTEGGVNEWFQIEEGGLAHLPGGLTVGQVADGPDLHVKGGPDVDGENLIVDGDGDSNQDDDIIKARANSAGSGWTDSDTKFVVKGDGRIGINTYNPSAILDVNDKFFVGNSHVDTAKMDFITLPTATSDPSPPNDGNVHMWARSDL